MGATGFYVECFLEGKHHRNLPLKLWCMRLIIPIIEKKELQ